MSQSPSLHQLQELNPFLRRHLGPDATEQQAMLNALGIASRNELIEQTVPPDIRLNRPLDLPAALDEQAALAKLAGYAEQNQVWTSLIGMGYHGTITPTVILRNVLENPGWYTAYTPYQPEIAQGRLEALLNFQQMVIDLTGLPLANASLLDEATAAAEAMALAKRVARNKSNAFFADEHCHPQTLSVLKTRAEGFGFELIVDSVDNLAKHSVFGALLQYPDTHGEVRDLRPLIDQLHSQQALACVAADLLSLVVLAPPGELGADVVLGSTQRFGVPMGYGGPHAAYFACRDDYKRAMPGAHHRRIARCPWQHRITDGPANPRAAYSPRKGQLQHLHGPGAVGQHCRLLRGVPRPGRPATHRAACAPVDLHPGSRP